MMSAVLTLHLAGPEAAPAHGSGARCPADV